MKKTINQEEISGWLYEHSLELAEVKNEKSDNYGKEYIRGSISVATDDEGLNVIPVYYTYVAPTTKSNQPNRSFTELKKIIESGKTWVNDGKENATIVKLTPSAALNDFYPQGKDELVSTQRSEGGFVTILSSASSLPSNDKHERNKFTFDALITNVTRVDADEEKGTDAYARIRCGIFNFKNDILPFTLVARKEDAINYFENLGASAKEPVFLKVWGKIVSTVVHQTKTEESAFGEASVETVNKTVREWVVTGASVEPYAYGDEKVITDEDVKKALADREVHLAEIKKRSEDYYANRGTATAAPTQSGDTSIPAGGFNF